MTDVEELIRSLELREQVVAEWRTDAEGDARARLRGAIREATQASGQGARRWRVLLSAGLIAAFAAALVVVFALGLAGGGSAELRLGVGQATARAVLARAVHIARSTPPGSVPDAHQFLYAKWITATTNSTTQNGHSFAFTNTYTEQDWEAPDGSGHQKLSDNTYGFPTPSDRAAWQAAGSPPLGAAKPNIDGLYPRGAYFSSCGGVPPRGPVGLSTNPAVLLRQVIHRYANKARFRSRTDAIFQAATCILVTSNYTPLTAAIYQMIGWLPGITLLGRRQDGIGRSGVAVGVPDRRAGIESVVTLDPTTARPLEFEEVQTRAVPRPGPPVGARPLPRR